MSDYDQQLTARLHRLREQIRRDASAMAGRPDFAPIYDALFDAIDDVSQNLLDGESASDGSESPQHDRTTRPVPDRIDSGNGSDG